MPGTVTSAGLNRCADMLAILIKHHCHACVDMTPARASPWIPCIYMMTGLMACAGVTETSDLNPDSTTLQLSYAEGRKLAAMHEMEDYETVLQELAAYPAELGDFKNHMEDKLLFRDIWHAMFLSGMTPWEHLDRHIVDTAAAGRRVELVDVPRPKLAELAQCAPYPSGRTHKAELTHETQLGLVLVIICTVCSYLP